MLAHGGFLNLISRRLLQRLAKRQPAQLVKPTGMLYAHVLNRRRWMYAES